MGKRRTPEGRTDKRRHVRHDVEMLNSLAYRSLDHYARSLLTELKMLYMGQNNGKLFMSLRTAADRLAVAGVPVSKATAKKALDALLDRGFIKAQQIGSFDWKQGTATTWILTEYPVGEALPTKDYQRWSPAAPALDRARRLAPHERKTRSHQMNEVSHQTDSVSHEVDSKRVNCPIAWDSEAGFGPLTVPPDDPHLIYHPQGAAEHLQEPVGDLPLDGMDSALAVRIAELFDREASDARKTISSMNGAHLDILRRRQFHNDLTDEALTDAVLGLGEFRHAR